MMDLINAIATTASRWADPDYSPRARATELTLECDNRFTEAAIVFAVNQQMSLLTEEGLTEWASRFSSPAMYTVGVLNPGNIPLVELQDLVAVLLAGHTYAGSLSSKTPHLLTAFIDDLQSIVPDLPVAIVAPDEVIQNCDKLIASGTDEVIQLISTKAQEAGLDSADCWLRGHRISVAVLDGREKEEELLALAEDALIHEGQGCRSTAVVFAPSSMDIDPVLDAFATLRGTFPAHSSTSGALKMQQAFLKAVGSPHAYADDHQFLLSRGEAEAQPPGHIRWVLYEDLSEVVDWLDQHAETLQCIYADERLVAGRESWDLLGSAQRPALDWAPDGLHHASFLSFQG